MVTSSMLLGLLQFAGQSGKQGIRLALMVNWWNTLMKSFVMLVRLCDTEQVCIWRRFRRWWLRGWISCYMSPQDCWQNQLSSGQAMLQLENAPWRGEGKYWKLPEDGVAPIGWSCQVTNVWTLRMDVCPVMYKGVCCTGRALNLVGLVVSFIITSLAFSPCFAGHLFLSDNWSRPSVQTRVAAVCCP